METNIRVLVVDDEAMSANGQILVVTTDTIIQLAGEGHAVGGEGVVVALPAGVVAAVEVDAILQDHDLVVAASLDVDRAAGLAQRADYAPNDGRAGRGIGQPTVTVAVVTRSGRDEDGPVYVAVDAIAVVVDSAGIGLIAGRGRRAVTPARGPHAGPHPSAVVEGRGDRASLGVIDERRVAVAPAAIGDALLVVHGVDLHRRAGVAARTVDH